MKTRSPRPARGFVNNELLIVLALLALLTAVIYGVWRSFSPRHNGRQIATQAKIIHGWLMNYAQDHGGSLPAGATANEAYRALFREGIGVDERQFWIPGDAWHGGREPDGDVGYAPDYARALERGECAFAYVNGLTTRDTARLPLIANAFTATPGVWCADPREKGGVFKGRIAVFCRLGGSSSAVELKEGEWTVLEKDSGRMVNIFTPGFEETQFTVVNPEP